MADDGGLVRIRLPGGLVTGGQLRTLAAVARDHGDGHLELTSRANVQIRGLAPDAHAAVANRVAAAGLLPSHTHERVRNILASALSGRDHNGRLDVRPLVAQLDRRLCERPELARLPGRFLFTVDDGRGDVAGLEGDVGMVAIGSDRLALLLAGDDSGVRTRPGAAVGMMVEAAYAFLVERSAQDSTAWRLAELADAAARIVGRIGGAASAWVEPHDMQAGKRARPASLVGSTPQRDGLAALGVVSMLGRLTSAQADLLAVAAADGTGELRVTPWREILVCDLPPDRTSGWSDALSTAGLVADPASPWVGATACAGRPGCGKARADVRADAARVHRAAANVPGPMRPVHWVGCERRCGRPRGDAVEVLATERGDYRVSRNGRDLARGRDLEPLADAVVRARRSR
jgi:precorrin-3B synthase